MVNRVISLRNFVRRIKESSLKKCVMGKKNENLILLKFILQIITLSARQAVEIDTPGKPFSTDAMHGIIFQ